MVLWVILSHSKHKQQQKHLSFRKREKKCLEAILKKKNQ